MGILDWLTGGAKDAAGAANQGMLEAQRAITGNYEIGRNQLRNTYRGALEPMRDVYRQGRRGADLYGDALGLGGAQGQQRAYDIFMRTPGYMAGLNTGMDAIDRRAASRGMLGSGNTNLDTQRFAQDYGATKFGDYISQLLPFLGQQMQGAQGIGNIKMNLGNNLANTYVRQGDQIAGIRQGIGNNNAGAIIAENRALGDLLNKGIDGLMRMLPRPA